MTQWLFPNRWWRTVRGRSRSRSDNNQVWNIIQSYSWSDIPAARISHNQLFPTLLDGIVESRKSREAVVSNGRYSGRDGSTIRGWTELARDLVDPSLTAKGKQKQRDLNSFERKNRALRGNVFSWPIHFRIVVVLLPPPCTPPYFPCIEGHTPTKKFERHCLQM